MLGEVVNHQGSRGESRDQISYVVGRPWASLFIQGGAAPEAALGGPSLPSYNMLSREGPSMQDELSNRRAE